MENEKHAKNLVNNHDSEMVSRAGTLKGAFMAALDWYGSEMLQCCLPCRVDVYDRGTRIATVSPLVKSLTRSGGFKEAESFSVQAFQYAANGFVIDFPIVPGDVGWVIASDRYTRNVKETHEVSDLEDISTHRYSSGFFIPDYYGILKDRGRRNDMNPYDGEDNRLVISTFDGTQKVSIGPADIKVYASEAKVFANKASVKTTGEVTLDAATVNAKGSVSVGNGASGLITSMSTAIVQNGIVTQIS